MLVFYNVEQYPLHSYGPVCIVHLKRVSVRLKAVVCFHQLCDGVLLHKRYCARVKRRARNVPLRCEKLFIYRIRKIQPHVHKLVLYHNGRNSVRLKHGLPRGNIYLLRGFGRKVGVKLYALFNKIIAVAVPLLPILKP